jgi:membrane associated rhomboid family serine protease
MTTSQQEKEKLIKSTFFPFVFLATIWIVKFSEFVFEIELSFLGVYPLKAFGLIGIICSPLIHGDWTHLMANSIPVFILTSFLFYFYRAIAFRSFLLIYVLSGIWLWFAGRDSYHIGASGLIYGMASFLFVSGILRRNPRLMALTLLITFLYGSLIWGIFPDFFPERNISWEGHLMGMVAGFIVAIYFRKKGPQAPIYNWPEEEDEEEDDPNAYWKRLIE